VEEERGTDLASNMDAREIQNQTKSVDG